MQRAMLLRAMPSDRKLISRILKPIHVLVAGTRDSATVFSESEANSLPLGGVVARWQDGEGGDGCRSRCMVARQQNTRSSKSKIRDSSSSRKNSSNVAVKVIVTEVSIRKIVVVTKIIYTTKTTVQQK